MVRVVCAESLPKHMKMAPMCRRCGGVKFEIFSKRERIKLLPIGVMAPVRRAFFVMMYRVEPAYNIISWRVGWLDLLVHS